jgi:dolichol-phosphate mannosyltransferase
MDQKVVNVLKHLPERMRFVRGLRSFVGFRQTGLAYERAARQSGKPQYSYAALVFLAIDGLISFSSYPLRLVTYLGVFTICVALGLLTWVMFNALYNHTIPQGWASTLVTVLFMGSIQLFSLGIIGEYIRLIFLETKQRPTYIMRDPQGTAAQVLGDNDEATEVMDEKTVVMEADKDESAGLKSKAESGDRPGAAHT